LAAASRVLPLAVALALGAAGRLGAGEQAMDRSDKLFETRASRGWRAEVEVFPSRRARERVSRLLYGKFCEHLGSNIYNGIWAQVLRNPGFEPWHFFGNDAQLAHKAEGLEREMGVKGLAASRQRGVAFPWVPCGQGDAAFALDGDAPLNSETSQRVAVASVPRGGLPGVAQAICLPLHRTRDYEFSLAARAKGPGPRLAVTLRRGSPDGDVLVRNDIGPIGPDWAKHACRLSVPDKPFERGEVFFLAIALPSPGTVWLDEAELFPSDHIAGFDPDAVRLWREARLPLLRYPGGNFASGYHWQDGVGPREKRPTRLNRAWNQPEPNHVGTDEFMAYCKAVGCEPFICVNAGDGTPEEAAAWVEYCNGAATTRFGRLRADNGHPEPYGVRIWQIGNELWGNWQIGHCSREEYAERYERFHKAMKAADPSIHLIACGQDLRWNEPLVARKGALIESVSIHSLMGGGLRGSSDPLGAFESLLAYPTAYAGVLDALRKQMAPHVAKPCIAITELQLFTNQPSLPNNGEIAEALFLAGIIHTAIRTGGLVELITHTANMNHGGGLRKRREIVYPNPVYFTSRLYATQPGVWPLGIRVATPAADVPSRGGLPAVSQSPCLDAVALLDDAGTALVVLAVNRHHDKAIPAAIRLDGFPARPEVSVQTIRGTGWRDLNTWQEPDRVRLHEETRRLGAPPFAFDFEPCSVTALTFRRAP